MHWSAWVLSAAVVIWLVILAIFEHRDKKLPGISWTMVPLLLAAIYRISSGQYAMVVAAVAVVMVISERRHLSQKLVEGIILAAGILVLIWILFTIELTAAYAVVGILVFWIGWERGFLQAEEAMALLGCVLIWPGIEFVMAYLVAGLVWMVGIRIKEGGWLKRHDLPGLAIIATAAGICLAYFIYKAIPIIL